MHNHNSDSGVDVIHLAAQRGCERMVSMIIAHRGDVNQKTAMGTTPLHMAANSSHVDRDR